MKKWLRTLQRFFLQMITKIGLYGENTFLIVSNFFEIRKPWIAIKGAVYVCLLEDVFGLTDE